MGKSTVLYPKIIMCTHIIYMKNEIARYISQYIFTNTFVKIHENPMKAEFSVDQLRCDIRRIFRIMSF